MLSRQIELKLIQKRKTIKKLVDQVVQIIKQLEAENELSKELLGNLQTDNSCDHKSLEAEVKMELLLYIHKRRKYKIKQ